MTVRTKIRSADFVTHHTQAVMFRQFNSENFGALCWLFEGIVSLPLRSDHMSTQPFLLYKGYELHPLVFPRMFSRFDGHSRYAAG